MKQQSLRSILGATTTPLASIFGSGFLVIVPILAAAVGFWSVAAMAGICALAYAVGWVIRHNIRHAEPRSPGTHRKQLSHSNVVSIWRWFWPASFP